MKLFLSLSLQEIDGFGCLEEDLCLCKDYQSTEMVCGDDLLSGLLCRHAVFWPECGYNHLVPICNAKGRYLKITNSDKNQ